MYTEKTIESLIENGLVERSDDKYKLTRKGVLEGMKYFKQFLIEVRVNSLTVTIRIC